LAHQRAAPLEHTNTVSHNGYVCFLPSNWIRWDHSTTVSDVNTLAYILPASVNNIQVKVLRLSVIL